MRISELSERSGVPLPTIKFYIREGLLPAGTRTRRNQADYSDEHLERLSLIQALKDDAAVPLAAIGRALQAASGQQLGVEAVIGALGRAIGRELEATAEERAASEHEVLKLAEDNGWTVDRDSRAFRDAVDALVIITRSFPKLPSEALAPYAQVAEQLARHEIPDGWQPERAPNAALRYAVLGTLLFEPLILSLRRMAHMARAIALTRCDEAPSAEPAESGTHRVRAHAANVLAPDARDTSPAVPTASRRKRR